MELRELPSINHEIILTPLSPAAKVYYSKLFDQFIGKLNEDQDPMPHGRMKNTLLDDIQKMCSACDHPFLANPHLVLNSTGEFAHSPTNEALDSQDDRGGIIHQKIPDTMPYESSKIVKLLEMIRPNSPIINNTNKVVIFSCWTRFLDL